MGKIILAKHQIKQIQTPFIQPHIHNIVHKKNIMKTHYPIQQNTYSFNITKSDVYNNKTLSPSVLYQKMESTAKQFLKSIEEHKNIQQHLFKLNILQNAYLRDRLKITHTIQKLNEQEVLFKVLVNKESNNELICNATFGFTIKDKIDLDLAS